MTARFLVLGVGNRMRGDDAIGSLAGERLAASSLAAGGKVLAIDCSVAPENYLGKVLELRPDEVILVDACDFGAKPGAIKLFEEADFEKVAYGLLLTHTLPLTLLAALIKKELNCRIRLIGVQPQNVTFGEPMSELVQQALPRVIALVEQLATEGAQG
jgi:hydrogenase 3 maturation protease